MIFLPATVSRVAYTRVKGLRLQHREETRLTEDGVPSDPVVLSGRRAAQDGQRDATTEPLPFGVHAKVLEPGRVWVGDGVGLA